MLEEGETSLSDTDFLKENGWFTKKHRRDMSTKRGV